MPSSARRRMWRHWGLTSLSAGLKDDCQGSDATAPDITPRATRSSRHHTDRHPPSPPDRRERNVDDEAGRVPGQRASGGTNYNLIFEGLSARPVALLAE